MKNPSKGKPPGKSHPLHPGTNEITFGELEKAFEVGTIRCHGKGQLTRDGRVIAHVEGNKIVLDDDYVSIQVSVRVRIELKKAAVVAGAAVAVIAAAPVFILLGAAEVFGSGDGGSCDDDGLRAFLTS